MSKISLSRPKEKSALKYIYNYMILKKISRFLYRNQANLPREISSKLLAAWVCTRFLGLISLGVLMRDF